MKLILIILIVVAKISASESSVYNFHVKTIENDSDFGDNLKMQTALNNERQQDLFKMSGKSNTLVYYPQSEPQHNFYYNQFNKKDIPDTNNNIADVTEIKQNLLNYETDKQYKENYNNYTQIQGLKTVSDSSWDNDINYDYQNNYRTKQQSSLDVPHQWPKFHKLLKNLPNEYNNNQEVSPESYVSSILKKENRKQEPINSLNRHIETTNFGNENQNRNKEIINLRENKSHENEAFASINNFVGTNLFDGNIKKCFSIEDVALLTARRDFESLIPQDLPQCLFNDRIIALLLNYFYTCHQMVVRTTSMGFRHLAEKAFYDTVGGYLNFYMVPVTKYSYYAGQIDLITAQRVVMLHQESKNFLNTNGNGWNAPLQNILLESKSINIEPLHIPDLYENLYNGPSFCGQLYINKDENQPDDDKMLVQLPKLDFTDNLRGFLGNIWLPFQRKKTFDLKSEDSAYIVVKFFETVTKCYRFENIDQELYNEQFKSWLIKNIIIHLSDDEFYPGLGAILRVYEYLKRRKKYSIGIGADLIKRERKDENVNRYLTHHIRTMGSPNTKLAQNETKDKVLKVSDVKPVELTKSLVEHKTDEISKESKLESSFKNSILNALDFKLPQTAIMTILVVAMLLILVIIFCCFKFFCKKKKKPELPVKPKKNLSSSSSTLFNSPVRFFHIRNKKSGSSNMDYSPIEDGIKKKKKSVKIEKQPLLNSDSSVSNSPVRKKKSKETTGKGKSKDSGKSNV